MRVIQDQRDVLAHWIYTREEWSVFRKWERTQKNPLQYVIALLFERQLPHSQITITGQDIVINLARESFANHERMLRRIQLRDAGALNILEIIYEMKFNKSRRLNAIRVPVPKGKLREAMGVQESLSGNVVY